MTNNKILKLFFLALLFLLVSSFGLPLIVDITVFLIICFLIKFEYYTLIIINSLLLVTLFFFNLLLNSNYDENKNFYRAHEKFSSDEFIYKKNVTSEMLMPHGDIIALEYCNNSINLAQPRTQVFITDENGFRNDKYNLNNSNIILVGDSYVAGSGNTQEHMPANILSKLTGKKIYSITSISGPDYYEHHIKQNLDKLNQDSNILLFYFEGNDFHYKFKKNGNLKYFNNTPVPYFKYKLGFGYEKLERIKDIIFIKTFKKIYKKNYFYKSIRPKSQRLVKELVAKWTSTCPIRYYNINGEKVGFFYKPVEDFVEISTHIIEDKKILDKIKKIYFIPTKYSVYQTILKNNKKINHEYIYLKKKYNKLGIEVVDLTEILISSAIANLKYNQLIYWKDDTHWNYLGIFAAMEFISNNL
tara:strand:- start:271 stop:1515 length:1245 start_codon:yes stop_codon:yes gene_type:complete